MPPTCLKNYLLILFTSISCISLFSCKNNDRPLTENQQTDSIINVLSTLADNNPDSVLTVTRQIPTASLPDTLNAKIHLLIGSIYQLKGEYDSSIAITKKAIELAGNNKRLLARLNNQIGIGYDYKSDYTLSLSYYQKAHEYFSQLNDSLGYTQIKNNIGLLYQNSGDFKRAKEYFLECLAISRNKNLYDSEIEAMSNLGSVENEMGHFDTALIYYKKVLKADLESGNESYISYSYHNIGETYKNLKQFDSAVSYYTKAIALKEKLSLEGALVNSYKGYADLLIEIKKFPEAKYYLDKSMSLVRRIGNVDYLKDCFYLQSRLAEKQGDFKTAYIASDSFYILKDSISGTRFQTELIEKEKEYEYVLSERLKQQKIDELENEKITFILFIIFFVGVSAALLILLRKQRTTTKQLQLQKQQIEEGLAQRTQLLSFIAHEIRNPLGGIMGLTELMLNENPTESQKELLVYQKKASSHLLSLMNDVLDYQKLGSGKVELNSIRFNLKDVLYQVYGLYQVDIREKNLVYELSYDEHIPDVLMGDPIRLTQIFSNLLNNAIKFTDKGKVSISVQLNLDGKSNKEVLIDCIVSDSGVGIPKEEQEKIFELYVQSSKNKAAQLGTGLGLSIVRNLLQLMNSKIEMTSTQGKGTDFSFTIPFKLPQ